MTEPRIQDFQGRRIHMIGIGGSSMSGLAELLLHDGYQVTGSDNADSAAVKRLRGMGVPVEIGHRAENVRGAAMVVYTAAILADNPERVEVARLDIPNIERAVLLGQLMEGSKTAIGVCGAHGKTTTTAMLAQALMACGMNPSVHIGGQLDAIGGSTRVGGGDVFLAEACEFHGSFLHMKPTVAVVLNIDADHLDYYKDIDDIEAAFAKFLALLPEDGLAVGWGADARVRRLFSALPCRTATYGFTEDCEYFPERVHFDAFGRATFDVTRKGEKRGVVSLRVPGSFQVLNALAAITTAELLGADVQTACEALSAFAGVHRRFELTGEHDGVAYYHDYGHNPVEMRNVLSVARKFTRGRLIAVMQPHTYSRVKRLFDDYLTCSKDADVTLVTDICAAREKDPGDIHASQLVAGMRENGVTAELTPTFDDAERWLNENARAGDLVLTMGCGDINLLNEQINRHRARPRR